ncbi:protocatechuate 4,5-dioxygenase alpha subunit /protocatechuate 4,5-dioxygenase beta subunit [Chromohalobacter marismortui]|uniref:Protocatechuate 4,5-dioxygenase alpha subunit /protocatechuate 4,5-dioxygenase beta subunit n=1 Tax=Chromohalobacter marismortui TaxID=42055 RepID=A0A4V3F3M8_9GAMM|nr:MULTISPECIES: gallate dioxygenase [Chromohalobacter]MCI0509694.1 gallate dioxygenase [Chromohalobacter sp.]MCI0593343.1 gallate dioxygenase [Chromohalobacter sp.]TDU21916.1 protocatechuate 4,5-dioxygenase alpha subunit /protocatechuate 4,5-dioxygenase beta subunit [Chromohalobacter marismortui]
MARIVGGLAVSHTPTIGFAVDHEKQEEDAWAPIFESFAPMTQWLQDKRPDVLFYIFNDHVTSFFFDHYSAFVLGIDDHYEVADEGGGPRDLPGIGGHAALSRHIGESLMADEFDMSFFQDKPLDHGLFSPMSALLPFEDGWPVDVVPLQVGVLQFPIPSAARCYKLGQALRRAIESYPDGLDVAIVATGGVSHQVHGERAGFNNPEWDAQFLDLLVNDPQQLTQMTQAEFATLGGLEGSEVITYLIMRGALSHTVIKRHQDYYLPSMTGIATLILENQAQPNPIDLSERYRQHSRHQLAGIEALEGTYPFTLERSRKGYRINRFLHRLIEPDWRERFLADPEALFEEAALSEEERRLIRERDWRGMIHYGVIFFLLEKLGAVIGTSNLHIYAAMRGESLEEFQKTRNQQVTYSVARRRDTDDASSAET